ncbi:hypothetical protein RND81_08G018200 [Saponaria officinalis]|uniref:Pentatricopeptide repeat-containing protein n=1 Tax=Saponaria officinalis TaxID=3572 RepID=A0AAW1J1S0_SAPOF
MVTSSLSLISNLKPYPSPQLQFKPSFPQKPTFISLSLTKPTSSFSSTTHQLPPNFTPKQLIETLRKQNDAEMALWVFDWASNQPNFRPTLSVFEEIIRKLGNEGDFDSMIRVLSDMKKFGCEVNQSTFLIFIESYVGFGLV